MVGGAGGQIVNVTNLNDSGAGSLREALSANYSRIIRFAVSGTIELQSRIAVDNPYLTVEGQTAPNGGICLKGWGLTINAPEIIIQHLRIRPGVNSDPGNSDAVYITANAHHICLDHCSISWATDEDMSIYGQDVTIQNCIISEGLSNAGHPYGEHSKGLLTMSPSTRLSIHHNLFAHNRDRNPVIAGGRADIVDNVIYNAVTPTLSWGSFADAQANYVGNRLIPGLDRIASSSDSFRISGDGAYAVGVYVDNNICPTRPNDSLPEADCIYPNEQVMIVADRWSCAAIASEEDVFAAYDWILANAGAILPKRDAVDQRIVADVQAATGAIIDDPSEVGGWPDLTV